MVVVGGIGWGTTKTRKRLCFDCEHCYGGLNYVDLSISVYCHRPRGHAHLSYNTINIKDKSKAESENLKMTIEWMKDDSKNN